MAEAVVRVGRRYLALFPAEADVVALRRQLGPLATSHDVLDHAARLEEAVRRDFAAGDLVAVDGWILSRTELRAAALVALTRGRG